jgi:hypothetical protein
MSHRGAGGPLTRVMDTYRPTQHAMPTSRTLELVVFTLTPGTTREQFLATNNAVSEWIQQQPGFVPHELCYAAEADRWIEIAWWESLDEAEAAAPVALSSEACAPMFALIEMESALMLHGHPAITPVLAQREAA